MEAANSDDETPSVACTEMVYSGAMATSKQVRRSVTLPARLAEEVERLARKRRLSDNRVLVELVEQGLAAQKEKEKTFYALAERFRAAADPEEIKRLGDELGRFIFGR
jgi:EAL domain-containing protein (putative c-di-GMP-specific phosphodiesterase class I)